MINGLDEIKTDFLVYAKEDNEDRIFPDARDGLKPGQRAVLYTMYRKGFSSDKPHVKSAKISGAVIGEIWPHGDVGVYGSMVRMSQDWINNLPEINWHGGNGSLLGGPEAANQRYTECRLDKSAEDGLFSGLKFNTVKMIPTYSEDDTWPEVLPALMPRLYLNGAAGVGVAWSCKWEPHNLKEITKKVKDYLQTGKVDCNDIYPDYPTGGIIINKSELKSIYETGNGRVVLRGKVEVSGNSILITELPYQVYAEEFITKVKNLVNEDKLDGIENIMNKSDDNGLLIEIECSSNPYDVLQKLYRKTNLQVSIAVSQKALVDKLPIILNLEKYIKIYTEHNISCIVNEYTNKLENYSRRLEIVEGLIKAVNSIDEVIKSIKESKDVESAKKKLVLMGWSERQAQAIVDMKLGRLANLEIKSLEEEFQELVNNINLCNKILGDENEQKKVFIDRLDSFTKKYGWNRRTKVIDEEVKVEKRENKPREKRVNNYMVMITAGGELKRVDISDYRPKTKVISPDDIIIDSIQATNLDRISVFTEDGKLYKVLVKKIKLGKMNSSGILLSDLVGESAKPIKIIKDNSDTSKAKVLLITNTGLGKKMEAEDIYKISKRTGTELIKSTDGKLKYVVEVDDSDSVEIKINDSKTIKVSVNNLVSKGKKAGAVKLSKVRDIKSVELLLK